MPGLFGDLFDFNHDGHLDSFEEAADCAAFAQMMSMVNGDDKTSELEAAGLDQDELDMMDTDERRETIENAGLDPFDFE